MKNRFAIPIFAILWLAFSSLAGASTLFTLTGLPNETAGGGGQFTALVGSSTQDIFVYCVDYRNDVGYPPDPAYSVNLTTLSNSTETFDYTRYGQTPTATFSFSAGTNGTAQDRYAMAAWLVTQYNFTSGVTSQDNQIQNAIWTLLDTDGTVQGSTGTYLTQAESWIAGLSSTQLTNFENEVTIYTATTVAGQSDPARWGTGEQEFLSVTPCLTCSPTTTPEPSSMIMLGSGLLAVGLFGRRLTSR